MEFEKFVKCLDCEIYTYMNDNKDMLKLEEAVKQMKTLSSSMIYLGERMKVLNKLNDDLNSIKQKSKDSEKLSSEISVVLKLMDDAMNDYFKRLSTLVEKNFRIAHECWKYYEHPHDEYTGEESCKYRHFLDAIDSYFEKKKSYYKELTGNEERTRYNDNIFDYEDKKQEERNERIKFYVESYEELEKIINSGLYCLPLNFQPLSSFESIVSPKVSVTRGVNEELKNNALLQNDLQKLKNILKEPIEIRRLGFQSRIKKIIDLVSLVSMKAEIDGLDLLKTSTENMQIIDNARRLAHSLSESIKSGNIFDDNYLAYNLQHGRGSTLTQDELLFNLQSGKGGSEATEDQASLDEIDAELKAARDAYEKQIASAPRKIS